MVDDDRITWLHLSDFHVGMDGYAQRKLFSEITGYVAHEVELGYHFDLIFLTGDLANRGAVEEYNEFLEEFLLPLLDSLGSAWQGRIYGVPGNHDVERGRNPHFTPSDILRDPKSLFDPTTEGLSQRQQLLPRFQNFLEGDHTNSPRWLDSQAGAFDLTIEIKGQRVAIVGVNTSWLSKDERDRHLLTPGSHILEDALKRQASAELKIVLGHHPLDWFADTEAANIRTILSRHHAIYLHGHLHEDDAHYESGGGLSNFLALRCGSAFQGRPEDIPKWVNGFQRAGINIQSGEILVQALYWSAQHREWKISTSAFSNERKKETIDWVAVSNTRLRHSVGIEQVSSRDASSFGFARCAEAGCSTPWLGMDRPAVSAAERWSHR